MRRSLPCPLFGALLLIASALTLRTARPPRATAQAPRPGVVRIGVVDSLFHDVPEPLMQVMMRPFRSLLESSTGTTGQMTKGGDPCALAKKLKDRAVDLGVFHGVEFAWARQKCPGLRALIIAVNRHTMSHAHLVVRKDSKASSYSDLAGKPVALPGMSREHCRLFFERRCVKPGTDPEKFYSKVTKPSDPEEALDELVDGKVDATVVDLVALENYRKIKPGRARQLKDLLVSEGFPPAVLAYHHGKFDEDLARRFRAGLIAAKSTRKGRQMLELMRITGFEEVPAGYDRMLAAIVKAYPPPSK